MRFFNLFALLGLSCLFGCSRYYLSLEKERINASSLASSSVHTPDPRQKDPPRGEKLIIEWYVPREVMEKHPHIEVEVVYWDFTTEKLTFPMKRNMGYVTYDVLGERYKTTKGLLAYQAEICEESGAIYKTWTHQLFVKVIKSQDEPVLSKEELLEEPSYDEIPFDNSW